MSLKQKTVVGVRWSALSNVAAVIVQMVQVAILARFLKPDDFGLMAIAQVVVGFSQSFTDMGVSNIVIQKHDITASELNSLYWLNVFGGALVFGVVLIITPAIVLIYQLPELSRLLLILSSTFLIQGFGQQYFALLQRELRFREIAVIEIIARIFSLVVSSLLAMMDFRVDSLVLGTVAATLVTTIGFIAAGRRLHRPKKQFDIELVRGFIGFGAFQMGEKIVNYFNSQVDTLVVGAILGTAGLGTYNMAKQLVLRPSTLINPILIRVSMPVLSKLQFDTRAMGEVYCRGLNYLASTNFLVYAALFLFSDQIVLLYLGVEWLKVIPILKILTVWAAIRSTANPVGTLLIASGKARLAFVWNLVLFLIAPPVIYLGGLGDLRGVCVSQLVLIAGLIFPTWYWLVYPICKVKFDSYVWEISKPALIAVCAGVLAYISSVPIQGGIQKCVLMSAVLVGVWFVLNWFWNRKFIEEALSLLSAVNSIKYVKVNKS